MLKRLEILSISLRLTFPSCAQTTSPLQILPQFVEVLGRKLDKTATELDPRTK